MKKFWVVNAFTNQPFRGNPAAVMIVDEFPENMLEIAAEFNLSETAFLKSLGQEKYHIRWFTPKVEVKLCGHATLAAAHVLFKEIKIPFVSIEFSSLSGSLQVGRVSDGYELNFPLQYTGPQLLQASVQEAFGSLKIKEVLQAYDDIIVVLDKEEDLLSFTPDISKLSNIESRGIIVTAQSRAYDFISRFFAPRVGVNEDPVTGSAHCKLADYWSKKLGKQNMVAFQASSRGGELNLSVSNDRVLIKGEAVTTTKGELLV